VPARPLSVLLITRGHPFQRDAFFAMFESMADINITHVEHPAAQVFFDPIQARAWDAFVLYDMPGLDFRAHAPPRFVPPPEPFRRNFRRLLDEGFGFVFLHHALAGWPAWPEYGEIIGGRFLYQPMQVRGTLCQDSGYRQDVTHQVRVLAGGHPVVEGLPERFTMTDELYLAEVFEDSVVPLLASDYGFVDSNFHSAALALAGEMYSNRGWSHQRGSPLVGWARRESASPLVYLQGGDGPSAYADPNYRRLVDNAIHWVSSPTAHAWARTPDNSTSRTEASK